MLDGLTPETAFPILLDFDNAGRNALGLIETLIKEEQVRLPRSGKLVKLDVVVMQMAVPAGDENSWFLDVEQPDMTTLLARGPMISAALQNQRRILGYNVEQTVAGFNEILSQNQGKQRYFRFVAPDGFVFDNSYYGEGKMVGVHRGRGVIIWRVALVQSPRPADTTSRFFSWFM